MLTTYEKYIESKMNEVNEEKDRANLNTTIEQQSKYIESLVADIHNLKSKLDEADEINGPKKYRHFLLRHIESLGVDINNLKSKLDEATEVITKLNQHIKIIEDENTRVFQANEEIHTTNMRLVNELEKRPAYVEPTPIPYEHLTSRTF